MSTINFSHEVRLDNVVDALGFEVIAEITKDSFHFKSGNGSNHAMPKPVGVTGAILLKCGFATKEDTAGAYYILLDALEPDSLPMAMLIWINGSLFIDTSQGQVPLWDKSVRGDLSLHMLQNLYYDLNGSELPVDL